VTPKVSEVMRAAAPWREVQNKLATRLRARGFDMVAPLTLKWYNDSVVHDAPDLMITSSPPTSFAVCVCNSKALWGPFKEWVRADPEWADHDPIDTYTSISIADALRHLDVGAEPLRTHVRYVQHVDPYRMFAATRLARAAGVGFIDPISRMCLNESLGPWFSIRALIIFDAIEGPSEEDRPPPPTVTTLLTRTTLRPEQAFNTYHNDPSLR
jgi:hypothetical protein